MSDNTDIDRDRYISATWNPIAGCTHVSEGCRNCNAERVASQFSAQGMWGHGFAERTRDGGRWTGRVELLPHKLDIPLRHIKPRSYFVGSTSDLFHRDLSDDDIDQVLARAQVADRHRYIILTKRPERMREYFTALATAEDRSGSKGRIVSMGEYGHIVMRWPLPNVWLGTSVENIDAMHRIDELRSTIAAVRFLSFEPLLGDLGEIDLAGIHWVIVGGESGPGARPMHPDWVRSIRDQCAASGVPFFFKQWGDFIHSSQVITWKRHQKEAFFNGNEPYVADGNGGNWWSVGNNRSGYTIDGKTWRQWPQ